MSIVRLTALAVSALFLSAADWPQWLGPRRDGRSVETGVAAAFTAGLQEVWRRSPGIGYSGVSVTGGVAYTMADEAGGQHVLALDAATGAERWRTRVDAAYDDKMGYHGPRSTPTVVDGKVVTLTATGKVVTLAAADGALLWSVDLVASWGATMPTWGFSGSPLVSDGRVYLDPGGRPGAGLLALSLADGSVAWQSGTFTAGYSSPVRATLDGVDQVVFFTGKEIVGVTPDGGKPLWSSKWTTNYDVNAATPIVLGPSQLFVSSGYGIGGAALTLSGGATRADVAWKTKRMKNKLATSVLHEGHLYGFNEDQLTCVDAATGEERWAVGGFGRGTLLLADGHLLVLGEDCQLALVEATGERFHQVGDKRQVLAHSPCWTVPTLSDGVLYLRDPKQVAAFRLGG